MFVESLLLILGQGVPGEGVVDGAHHAAVGVAGRHEAVLALLLRPHLTAQDPTWIADVRQGIERSDISTILSKDTIRYIDWSAKFQPFNALLDGI